MSVVRARTESQSWQQFYSDLLGRHSLDTILLTLARLRQNRETKLKLKGDTYIQVLLSLVGLLHYCALIGQEPRHKEPAQDTQSPLLGAFLAFRWFFIA